MLDTAMVKFMYNFYNDNKVIVLMSIVAYVIRAGIDTIVFPNLLQMFLTHYQVSNKKRNLNFP